MLSLSCPGRERESCWEASETPLITPRLCCLLLSDGLDLLSEHPSALIQRRSHGDSTFGFIPLHFVVEDSISHQTVVFVRGFRVQIPNGSVCETEEDLVVFVQQENHFSSPEQQLQAGSLFLNFVS